MRRLMRRLRAERGASAVIFAVALIPLLGAGAIAVDVGALYAERAKLQNGADAAAVAVAIDCATTGCGTPSSTATEYAAANDANDGTAGVAAVGFSTIGGREVVTVVSETREADGTDAIRHPLAQFIGIDTTTVRASGSAEWSGISGGATWPFSVSACDFDPSMIGDGRHYTIRFDTTPTGPNANTCDRNGHIVPGGFGWLPTVGGECRAISSISTGAEVQHGNGTAPTECRDEIESGELEGKTVYLPVHSAELSHGVYRVDYYVAFTITGWKFSGPPAHYDNPDPSALPANPACGTTPGGGGGGSGGGGRDCRYLQGMFVDAASTDPGLEGGGPDQGASSVKLIITPAELAGLTG